MPLKAIVESLDDVDDKYKDLYSERNGKYEFTGVEGLKTQADIDRIQSSLVKERNEHKATKDKFSFLADKNIEEIQNMLDKFPELEAIASNKGNDEEKLAKLVEARLNTATAPLKRELDNARKELNDKNTLIEGLTVRERTRTVHDSVRDAIGKMKGFTPTATDDVLMYAERVFEVGEDGKVTARDGVGVTPGIEPSVWLSDMQSKKPHWFGMNQGGGAGGSGSGFTGNNPWSHDNWNMTEQAKLERENPAKAEQLAKMAGSSVGGLQPPKK